jgi:hypothetical protein
MSRIVIVILIYHRHKPIELFFENMFVFLIVLISKMLCYVLVDVNSEIKIII